jgi:hypothetical protein
MNNGNTKQIISTDKFNQLLSIYDSKEREVLIGSDLTQVKFRSPAYLGGFNLSDAILENIEPNLGELILPIAAYEDVILVILI